MSKVKRATFLILLSWSALAGAQLSSDGVQFWVQEDAGLASENFDAAGSALAIGDFNNDGLGDLAIGVNKEDVGDLVNAGMVVVLSADSRGWAWHSSTWWWQGSSGVPGLGETWDHFGESLAVGDFDCDGYDDLAIGSPGEAVGDLASAGAVNVLYGGSSGLTSSGSQIWHQDVTNVFGEPEPGESFGAALAAGDFNNDTCDDLAVGIPYDNWTLDDIGAVQVFYGTVSGLTTAVQQLWSRESPGVQGAAGNGDRFGDALVSGDFDGDGYDDLGIGVPRDDNSADNDGAVNVLFGSSLGLDATGNKLILSPDGEGAEFGSALAAGDNNNDGFDDLLIGAPGAEEYNGGEPEIGSFSLWFGGTGFPSWFSYYQHGAFGYGSAVASGDFDGNGRKSEVVTDLEVSYSGRVESLQQSWFNDLYDGPDSGDNFGWALAVGDLNGDGADDLAIAIPGQNVMVEEEKVDAGVVQIVFGNVSAGIFSDGFEGGDVSAWSAAVP